MKFIKRKHMSRIGKKPIVLPAGVEAKIEGREVAIKGPKGELRLNYNPLVKVVLASPASGLQDQQIIVSISEPENRKQKAMWGLTRTLIDNMIQGVAVGFQKQLEINGIGYKASVTGRKLVLNVGFSHPVEFAIPEGIEIKTAGNVITVAGVNKQLVGETSAQIRSIKKPEPYKGKGIKYVGEQIRRKAGKAAKAVGGKA